MAAPSSSSGNASPARVFPAAACSAPEAPAPPHYPESGFTGDKRFTIEDFEISRSLIGEGKFGRVFRAREKASRRVVVIKSIDKQAILEEDVKGQLQREVEVHCRLRHPNIVRLFAYFTDEERGTLCGLELQQHQTLHPAVLALCPVYLVLECVPGGNVFQRLQEAPGKRFPEALAASLVQQLCR